MKGPITSTKMKSRSSRGSIENQVNGTTKTGSGVETPVHESSTPETSEEVSLGNKTSTRLITMKKAADEQRRKVRETRSRLQEEERAMAQQRKQEELKIQIQTELENVMIEGKKDILLALQDRIEQEKHVIRRDLKADLEKSEEVLTMEMEKRMANGESFDYKFARIQKDLEENFYRIAKTELAIVQRDMNNEIDRKLEQDKRKWEENFTRITNQRIRETEEGAIQEFRSGVDDAQRHCDKIFNSAQDSVANLESRFQQKIDAMRCAYSAELSETQRNLSKLIDDGLNERDRHITSSLHTQNDRLRQEVTEIRGHVVAVRSKCCTIS